MIKIEFIQQVLNFYYPDPPVPLNHTDNFTFLVAVVLSAQTTDGKVNDVTKKLFKEASTAEAMAKLGPSRIEEIIHSVGLAPKKSVYLSKLSQTLVEKFEGKIPNNLKDLESLSGVGRKTASVIMSQSFGVPSFAVDTHVHRLALRWGLTKQEKNVDKVQEDLCNIFPQSSWNKVEFSNS
jgi:endonuclease-3